MTLDEDQDGEIEPGSPRPPSYKWVVLSLLFLASTINYLDRTILSVIGQAIKVDLKFTDVQLGLLGGLAFAIFYAGFGIPIARLAERFDRVRILWIAIVIWSGFTAACGAALSFIQLFFTRIGVGVGEAGLNPPSHSLISDYFEPRQRSTAFGFYMLSVPAGTMIGAVAGGWLADHVNWRFAFLVLGLAGLPVAAAIGLLVREPRYPRDQTRPPFSFRQEVREIGIVVRKLFGTPATLHMLLGLGLGSFATYGAGLFMAPFFNRVYGLSYSEAGLIIGLVTGGATGIGTVLGGFLPDRLSRYDLRWYTWVPAFGLLLAGPLYVLAFVQTNWATTACLMVLPGVFSYTFYGPTFAVVQNSVGSNQRATANSLVALAMNLVALGLGPPFVGLLIDVFANHCYLNPNDSDIFSGIYHSLAFTDPSVFAAHCPGGLALPGASRQAGAACRAALSLATRQGLICSFAFYCWAGFHFILASRTIARHLNDHECGQ